MHDPATRSPADPLGYYAALGVGPLADSAEIKAAYRRRAKILHPDRNPLDDSHQDFLELVDAYCNLSDRGRREKYDATAFLPPPGDLIDPCDPAPQPLTCSRCGKVTAQPRYIVFRQVKSFLFILRKRSIRGIFCRDCADRTAIRASTVTWLLGWWSLTGPWHSVKALVCNLRGGDKPKADNLWVLLHQARAFLAAGDPAIAHCLAEQAGEFARSEPERARIGDILRSAGRDGSTTARRLKNRWSPWNYAPVVQFLPWAALAVGAAASLVAVALRSQTDSVTAMITVHPAQAGEVRHVAVDVLKVRQRPSAIEPVVALIDRFTTVQVMDSAAGGEWARILTPGGITGYVPSRYLFGGPGDEQRTRWCIDQKGPDPQNGEVLIRRSGGEHRLTVSNATGKDLVVRLKTPNGQTLLGFFVKADASAVINDIPDGTFRAVFASGESYSRACGTFLDAMQTFTVPTAQVFQANANSGRRQELSVILPPVGDGPGQSHPLPLESFLD
jgi:hypothetical protein